MYVSANVCMVFGKIAVLEYYIKKAQYYATLNLHIPSISPKNHGKIN